MHVLGPLGAGGSQRWKELGVSQTSNYLLTQAPEVAMGLPEDVHLVSAWSFPEQEAFARTHPILLCMDTALIVEGCPLMLCQNLLPCVFYPLFLMVSLEQCCSTQLPLLWNCPLDSWSQLSWLPCILSSPNSISSVSFSDQSQIHNCYNNIKR